MLPPNYVNFFSIVRLLILFKSSLNSVSLYIFILSKIVKDVYLCFRGFTKQDGMLSGSQKSTKLPFIQNLLKIIENILTI